MAAIIFLIILIVLLIAAFVTAKITEKKRFIKRIEAFYARLESLKGSFIDMNTEQSIQDEAEGIRLAIENKKYDFTEAISFLRVADGLTDDIYKNNVEVIERTIKEPVDNFLGVINDDSRYITSDYAAETISEFREITGQAHEWIGDRFSSEKISGYLDLFDNTEKHISRTNKQAM